MKTRPTPRPEPSRPRVRSSPPGGILAVLSLVTLVVLLLSGASAGCRKRADRLRDQARQDSLMRDSSRRPDNPYKLGQGNDQYNRERENLGNLDSLVRPGSTIPEP